jgi:hypothetical protein
MGGIKHKFHDYYGLTKGEFSTDPEERLKQMLDVPTICKLCGKPIDKYSTSKIGFATDADHQRWEREEKMEMHLNCIHDRTQGG